MAFVPPHDRVLDISTSNSQTVFAISGSGLDTSYNTFSASMSVGDTTIGGVVEPGVAFKSGILTYSATNQVTVTGTAFESKGTFSSSGTKQVFMGLPGSRALMVDGAQTLTTTQKKQGRDNISGGASPAAWTRTVLTSGSGTYSTPAGCVAIRVRGKAGGGGGAGSGTSPGTSGAGGNTTFGTSLLAANGGGAANSSAGGAGGTASGGDLNLTGGAGGSGSGLTNQWGGRGAGSKGGIEGQPNQSAGGAAPANSGCGGGGAGCGSTVNSGGGGGEGGECDKLIVNPLSSYAYAVGAAGTLGAAGTGGAAGAIGGSGLIEIDEFY